jgi:hypothetical protein
MRSPVRTGLLGFSALLLALGSVMHARAYPRTALAAAASDLAPFYAASLKALWVIDSATLMICATAFALIAARPTMARPTLTVLLALIPGATATILYGFLGNFIAAHLLLLAAVAALVGGLMSVRVQR